MGIEQFSEQKTKRTARVDGVSIDVDRLIAAALEFPESTVSAEELLDFRRHDRGWTTTAGEIIGPKHIIDLAEACHADYDQMIAVQPTWEEHIRRVCSGDLNVPICMTEGGSVIDGAHRITKMFVEHVDKISTKRISQANLSRFQT